MKLIPALQPIICMNTRRVFAVEMLARWEVSDRVLSPAELTVPVAWAEVDIELAEYLCSKLAPPAKPIAKLFINVSSQTLEDEQCFSRWLRSIRLLVSTAPGSVVVEVTERVSDVGLAKRWKLLSESGAALVLDDFGEGHSSWERLQRYPWAYCKFDAKEQLSPVEERALAYCRRKRVNAVVEKIETKEAAERAMSRRLALQQGFHHGPPVLLRQLLKERKAV